MTLQMNPSHIAFQKYPLFQSLSFGMGKAQAPSRNNQGSSSSNQNSPNSPTSQQKKPTSASDTFFLSRNYPSVMRPGRKSGQSSSSTPASSSKIEQQAKDKLKEAKEFNEQGTPKMAIRVLDKALQQEDKLKQFHPALYIKLLLKRGEIKLGHLNDPAAALTDFEALEPELGNLGTSHPLLFTRASYYLANALSIRHDYNFTLPQFQKAFSHINKALLPDLREQQDSVLLFNMFNCRASIISGISDIQARNRAMLIHYNNALQPNLLAKRTKLEEEDKPLMMEFLDGMTKFLCEPQDGNNTTVQSRIKAEMKQEPLLAAEVFSKAASTYGAYGEPGKAIDCLTPVLGDADLWSELHRQSPEFLMILFFKRALSFQEQASRRTLKEPQKALEDSEKALKDFRVALQPGFTQMLPSNSETLISMLNQFTHFIQDSKTVNSTSSPFKIRPDLKDNPLLPGVLRYSADCAEHIGKNELALEYLTAALQPNLVKILETQDPHLLSLLFNSHGNRIIMLEKYDEAHASYNEALKYGYQVNDSKGCASIKVNRLLAIPKNGMDEADEAAHQQLLSDAKTKHALLWPLVQSDFETIHDEFSFTSDGKELTGMPLHYAAAFNQIDAMEILLENGASTDIANSNGETALHFAIHLNLKEAIKTLLENGAFTDIADSNGRTPLYYAIEQKKWDIIQQLLAHEKTNKPLPKANAQTIDDGCGRSLYPTERLNREDRRSIKNIDPTTIEVHRQQTKLPEDRVLFDAIVDNQNEGLFELLLSIEARAYRIKEFSLPDTYLKEILLLKMVQNKTTLDDVEIKPIHFLLKFPQITLTESYAEQLWKKALHKASRSPELAALALRSHPLLLKLADEEISDDEDASIEERLFTANEAMLKKYFNNAQQAKPFIKSVLKLLK